MRVIAETPEERDGVPLHVQPEWRERYPWLIQATTGKGVAGFDLGLFGSQAVGVAMERWRRLRAAVGCDRIVHARQVHAAGVRTHGPGEPGLHVGEGADGHATASPGVALAVSIADCVPIFMVDPEARVIAALHGGWRGVAAGIVEAGLAAMERLGASAGAVRIHLGPAICGECYEVGPEVHAALGLPVPRGNQPVDLRAIAAARAVTAGIAADRITTSGHCTRCSPGFHSARAGEAGRQMGVIGIVER